MDQRLACIIVKPSLNELMQKSDALSVFRGWKPLPRGKGSTGGVAAASSHDFIKSKKKYNYYLISKVQYKQPCPMLYPEAFWRCCQRSNP